MTENLGAHLGRMKKLTSPVLTLIVDSGGRVETHRYLPRAEIVPILRELADRWEKDPDNV